MLNINPITRGNTLLNIIDFIAFYMFAIGLFPTLISLGYYYFIFYDLGTNKFNWP